MSYDTSAEKKQNFAKCPALGVSPPHPPAAVPPHLRSAPRPPPAERLAGADRRPGHRGTCLRSAEKRGESEE
jgi:hypothetical protein